MLIIINKNTKEVINNHGTNSMFPSGNIPIELAENEEAIRIHDNSVEAQLILNAYEYHFDSNKNIIVTKTIQQHKLEYEQSNEYKKNFILEKLKELDNTVPRILEDIISQGEFTLHQSKVDVITEKQSLRQQLQELEG